MNFPVSSFVRLHHVFCYTFIIQRINSRIRFSPFLFTHDHRIICTFVTVTVMSSISWKVTCHYDLQVKRSVCRYDESVRMIDRWQYELPLAGSPAPSHTVNQRALLSPWLDFSAWKIALDTYMVNVRSFYLLGTPRSFQPPKKKKIPKTNCQIFHLIHHFNSAYRDTSQNYLLLDY